MDLCSRSSRSTQSEGAAFNLSTNVYDIMLQDMNALIFGYAVDLIGYILDIAAFVGVCVLDWVLLTSNNVLLYSPYPVLVNLLH